MEKKKNKGWRVISLGEDPRKEQVIHQVQRMWSRKKMSQIKSI